MKRVAPLEPWAEWREQAQSLMQAAYAKEAELLKVHHFPPVERQLGEVEAGSFFGVIDDGELIGVVELERSGAVTIVASLAVLPSRFRQGIARELIRWILRTASRPIELSTAAGNAPARALYRAMGFLEQSRERSPEGIELVRYRHGDS